MPDSLAALVFSFTQFVGQFVIQPFDIVVPVPVGVEDEAGRVVKVLGRDGSGQFIEKEPLPDNVTVKKVITFSSFSE